MLFRLFRWTAIQKHGKFSDSYLALTKWTNLTDGCQDSLTFVKKICFYLNSVWKPYIFQWNYLSAIFLVSKFPIKKWLLKTFKEQKYSWNDSKGWEKGVTAPLLEEPAGQQCGWVRRSELLDSPSPGTWESNRTLLTVSPVVPWIWIWSEQNRMGKPFDITNF